MKRGDIVTVSLFQAGTGLRRCIRTYEARTGTVVVICAEDEWQRSIQEGREPEGVGFPGVDVADAPQEQEDKSNG